ncbi:MAG: MFS transporter [Candidatus Nanoarchaeia archaeon]|nr:MFS transporter [Candidatus Nanoarchaeia archaeon]
MNSDYIKKVFGYWQVRILISAWITYAAFYLVRVNMSVAIPGIIAEYGMSKTEIGIVLTALFTTYAIGQFINGQLGDKVDSRYYVTLGLAISAIINLIFGFFSNGIMFAMILLWGLNGIFQSMGWAPTVKTINNWYHPHKRGKASGILGTSYIFGNAVSWAFAGLIVGLAGWRWAFIIPGIVCLFIAVHWFILGRSSPEKVNLPPIEEEGDDGEKASLAYTLKKTLTNKYVWIIGFGLFFLNIVRYGFMDWAVTYMFEIQKATISTAAYKAILFPIAGILGALSAGFISDKFLKTKRAPVAAVMLVLLSIAVWLYPKAPLHNWVMSLALLMAVGFFTFGPHVLMVTAMPMDFGKKKVTSSITGFIDGMGYIGAAITGVLTGWLVDNYNWQAAFDFWLIGAILSAVMMFILWAMLRKK